MEVRGFCWVMRLLLLLLDRQSSGTWSNPGQDPAGRRVDGIVGGSVSLPAVIPPGKAVDEIEWECCPERDPCLLIIDFMRGSWEEPNSSDQFYQRLEKANETTLRIKDLKKQDSGVYTAYIWFKKRGVQLQTFVLRVAEPVPEPQILHRLVSRTAEACNVTLQCLGSEKGGIKVSWKRGDQLSFLEGSSDRYQLSAGSTELHVSWRPNSSDSAFTCLLSNPVDQKNTSLDLVSICQNERVSRCFSWLRVAMLVGVLVQILTVASLNVLERIGQKQN